MNYPTKSFFAALGLFFCVSLNAAPEALPERDTRADKIIDLNTPRVFPQIASKAEWQTRAQEIREQILISAGLWPMPEKTPLHAKIFGKIVRDGYSIEKVYFQTLPGFYLAGNLYRPVGQGNGPFPGILNAHGHWSEGRLVNNKDSNIPARCINFAKQGMVAFAYDMFGFNDTHFPLPEGYQHDPKTFYKTHRNFALDPPSMLWNISLMGLQTWNSIRVIDFMESLPDVDKTRLACTGASGGGTQTFMLGAVDDRLAAQAPICMVSHTMQGGCGCENMPGLRVEYSNMEIAATPAPRPQILVASFSDWTKDTLTIEGPAVESIYKYFGPEDRLCYVRFDFGHNYNQTSREAVYEFFGKHLLHNSEATKEKVCTLEPDSEMRIWPDNKLPDDAVTEKQLIDWMIARSKTQLAALKPHDAESFARYEEKMLPAWQHTLQLDLSGRGLRAEVGAEKKLANCRSTRLTLGRAGKGDQIPALLLSPLKNDPRTFVILVHEKGRAAFLDANGAPMGLADKLLKQNLSVLLLDTFLTGELADKKAAGARKKQVNLFFTTYNRTDLQERVQDIVTACAFAKGSGKGGSRGVIVCGSGQAGLWALLAAPVADAVVADCDELDLQTDAALVQPKLFAPGLRKIGAFQGAASLAAPHPVLLHNTGEKFSTAWLRDVYGAVKAKKSIRVESARLEDKALAKWIAERK